MSDDDWMWIWWVGTMALCLWKIIEATVFRPARMLEWPFLACAMWAYFYGFMSAQAWLTLPEYLGHGIANIGQLVPFLSLIGLLAGWSVGKSIPPSLMFRRARLASNAMVDRGRTSEAYPYLLCWLAGIGFLVIGAVGAYTVAHDAETEGINSVQTSSAYWYLLFYVGYPGLAISIWALFKMKGWKCLPLWIVTGLVLIAFMLPHVMNARRGPLFPAIIVLLVVPPLTLRRPPNRLIYCGGLTLAALVMMLFLQIRAVTYNGGSWGEALKTLDVNKAVERGDAADDNEYINNCQVISTVFDDGKYEYGTGHLSLLVHWFPRAFWPDKPELGTGIYSNNELYDDIEKATGVRLLGSGASAAGVADSFLQYGFLCPLFWFGLAAAMGAVYAMAVLSPRPWWIFVYVGFLCASHWLISQSFSAAFVPGMYFQSVPLVLLLALWLHRRLSSAPRKARPRQRPQPLAQPAPLS